MQENLIDSNLAPIVLFAYNRPHYLAETLAALRKNKEAKLSRLIIFCDGPKKGCLAEDLAKINAVRDLAKAELWCSEVEVVESLANKGLAASVVDGVTKIVNQYGKIIVLEDDIVVAPYFLKYMNDALNIYEEEEKVASISAHNFPIKFPEDHRNSETFLLKSATTWGWGTWKRGWDLFNNDAGFLLNKIKLNGLEKEFDFNGAYPFSRMLKDAAKDKVQSWGVRWYASLFLNNSLTLFPRFSMVENIGTEGTNIKVDSSDFIGYKVYNSQINEFEKNIKENSELRIAFVSHFHKHNRRRINFKSINYLFKRIFIK